MGDANHICTLGEYSKPRHEGYMNTIELLVGNNVGILTDECADFKRDDIGLATFTVDFGSVCYKKMDQDSAHMVAASKVLMLKPGEYELWQMRMEQYIQMIDYSLWEVIENDAKLLMQVVEKRFGGNAATKKTQRNLLKQQYVNLTASSSKVLDQTFDRLQKLISQLEIHGESITQEDVNQKFLRNLSP
nr:hypothetical protein [Tanacetum cinerariifolium]